MKERTYCPALKREIVISRKGWDHIFSGRKSRRRNVRDKINRLKLLKEAKYIIRNVEIAKAAKRDNQEYFELRRGKVYVVLKVGKSAQISFHSVYKD